MNIIIHGPGRSGTTLFNKMFSYHPDFVWLSSLHNKFPNQAWLVNFNKVYQNQWFGHTKNSIKPVEAQDFWSYYFEDFSSHASIKEEQVKACKHFINTLKKTTGKKHFVTKLSGEPRKEILDKVFDEDYLVLWMERDPRVVISSYVRHKWLFQDKEQEFNKMSGLDRIEFYTNYYKKNYYEAKKLNRKVVKYESLCSNPLFFFKNVLSDLGLPFHRQHKKVIRNWSTKELGWRYYSSKLSQDEANLLNHLLKEEMKELDYSE